VPTPSDRDASFVIGMGLREALLHAAPTLPQERYPELGLRYRHHYQERQHELLLFDGALALLDALKKRRHLLAVATGKSRVGLDEVLAAASLQGLFDATRTADETASKPHPRMLLELMHELGADPARTLMIGDTTHDLLLAANAGTASLAVSYGAHDSPELIGMAPRHVAHSMAELSDWLLAHA
jgi:phosphoglycolate phosphatase